MKFFKLGLSQASKPTSFGQKRIQQMAQTLSHASVQRKNLLKKEFATPNPFNKFFQQKGQRLDAQICKIKDEIKK